MTIFILVGIFFVAALLVFAWLKSLDKPALEEKECNINSDCVPNECCDADLCVAKVYAPKCLGDNENPLVTADDVQCPLGAQSYGDSPFLGQGITVADRGTCACVNNKCTAVWPE